MGLMSEDHGAVEIIAAPEFQRRIRDLSKKYRQIRRDDDRELIHQKGLYLM
jgi:predicted secreted Zn-dependent protease